MQITVTLADQSNEEDVGLLLLEVFPEMTVEALQSSIQAETEVEPKNQFLYYNGLLITDVTKTLRDLNVANGDMLALRDRRKFSGRGGAGGSGSGAAAGEGSQVPQQLQSRPIPEQAAGQGGGAVARRRVDEPDMETIRLRLLGDTRLREEAMRQQPHLAAVLDDPVRFAQYFSDNYERERREQQERQRQIAELNADPFDVEAQARIEEIIRQQRVMENLKSAIDYNPEVFGRVHLLYVDAEVNGYKVKALVDSGAQATIMSPSCAEACGIMRLVDKRFSGVARGVGTATIIGRVHSAQIKIGSLYLPCSFTVMEGKAVELLLGLDMLKRHQACIDLLKDRLIIQGTEITFLGEADIPKEAEEALTEEPTIAGPSGTTIGQRSGAVLGPEEEAAAAVAAAAAEPAPVAVPTTTEPSGPTVPMAVGDAPTTAPTTGEFPEEAIQQLMALGFPREAAVNSLQATGGNVEYAASLLFQG